MARAGHRAYRNFKDFCSSGLFYILLGIGFLFVSSYQIGEAGSHPSFIFLLAILGVAIILYGTGTQAVGRGSTGRINVAIAGGAGVLAMVLGFGVVKFNKEIQEVFAYDRYYAVVELETDNPSANLDDFVIRAELPNRQPLFLWERNQVVRILVPVRNIDKMTELKVVTRRRDATAGGPPIFNQDYQLEWNAKRFRSRKPGVETPVDGQILAYAGIDEDIKFAIKDRLVVTPAEDVVASDLILPQ